MRESAISSAYALQHQLAAARNAAQAQVAAGFLLEEDMERAVGENLGLYDRIMAHDPADRGCDYLFGA